MTIDLREKIDGQEGQQEYPDRRESHGELHAMLIPLG